MVDQLVVTVCVRVCSHCNVAAMALFLLSPRRQENMCIILVSSTLPVHLNEELVVTLRAS